MQYKYIKLLFAVLHLIFLLQRFLTLLISLHFDTFNRDASFVRLAFIIDSSTKKGSLLFILLDKFMKKSLLLYVAAVAVVASLSTANSAYAMFGDSKEEKAETKTEAAANLSIGYVDMQVVEAESLAVIDLVEKLQQKQKDLQDEITDKSKELQQQAQELEAKRTVLSASALEEKRKNLERDLLNFQNLAQKKNEAMQQTKTAILADIDNEVRVIVKSLASKRKVDLVLAEQIVLYINKSSFTDLTSETVKELNTKIKSVEFNKIYNEMVGTSSQPVKEPKKGKKSKK